MTARHLNAALFALCALVSTGALAQPANDTCANAQVLTFNGNVADSTVVTDIVNAAATAETGMSCTTAERNTVWFTFVAPATGPYAVLTCDRTTFSSAVAVYSGTCGALTELTSGCNSVGCSPGARVSGLNLTAGTTYFVQVASTTTSLTAASQIQLSVGQQTTTPADSCGAGAPQLQLGRTSLIATEPTLTTLPATNDAQMTTDGGCYVGIGHTVTTATAGLDVAANFRAPAAGNYSFRVGRGDTSTTPNQIIYLANTCLPGTPPVTYEGGSGNACVAAANRTTSASNVEELSCIPMTANQSYTLWIDQSTTTSSSLYPVEVAACFPENEVNDQPMRANGLRCPITASIDPVGDVDFFALGTRPGAKVYALIEGNATSVTDYDLRVTTETDTLEYDDANATSEMGTNSAVIAGTPLPNEPAWLRADYGTATAQGPYRLHAMLKFGAPAPETEPNDTAATANAAGLFVTGDIPTTADFDFFEFTPREGDLVFLALDSSPTRAAGTVGNHNIQIVGPDLVQIALTADTGSTTVTTASPGTLTGTTPNFSGDAYVFRARATGRHFARVNRTSTTGTGTYTLAISLNCGMVQPAVTAVGLPDGGAPASGSIIGGDTLTVTGSGFDESSEVRVGGALATVVSRTGAELVVTTPSGAEGPADVSVTNFGDLTATLPGAFLYISPVVPPTITSVTPATGPLAGGATVTLTGTIFKPGAEVSFTVGGSTLPATNVVVQSATSLTCTTPPHAAGPATVTVTNPADNLPGSASGLYTYVAAPTFAGISPATGLTLGGLQVTITGTGFLPGATVLFGAVPATGVVVAGDGLSLTANTPAVSTNGAVTVTVRNPDGQQAQGSGAFSYAFPAPTISSISPAVGFAAGRQVITINGTAFLGSPAPVVTIGGAPLVAVQRVSATRLTGLTPAGMAGPADVVVTNRDGQSVTAAGGFTYVSAPVVSSVTPARGPAQGGTRITLTGANFQPGARVTVAGLPAFAPVVVNSTTISVVTNSGPPGPADVVVQNLDTQEGTLAAGYTYDPAPSLTAISPASGTTAGGTVVTLTGSGFRTGATVRFGSTAATAVTVSSPTELQATTPARPLGVVTVRVTNDDGQEASLVRAFRFVAPPTLTQLSPDMGDVTGGTVVRLTGTQFTAQSTVTFGGVAAQAVAFVDANTLDAVAPAGAPGTVDVAVHNANGDSATLAGAYRYTRSAPTVSSLAPASGLTTGGAQVSVLGTGFAQGATVTFGGVAATAVVMASPELLRVIAPAHAAGAVDVVVTNDDSQAATLAAGFIYVEPPEGQAGVVTDGGNGGLDAPDAGTGPTTPTGCGCSSLEGSVLAFAALGLLLRRRRA